MPLGVNSAILMPRVHDRWGCSAAAVLVSPGTVGKHIEGLVGCVASLSITHASPRLFPFHPSLGYALIALFPLPFVTHFYPTSPQTGRNLVRLGTNLDAIRIAGMLSSINGFVEIFMRLLPLHHRSDDLASGVELGKRSAHERHRQ